MKQRVSLSMESDTITWITERAQAAGDNVSHYIEAHFRQLRLAEAVAAEARFGREHGLDEYEQDERDALDAEIDRGSAA